MYGVSLLSTTWKANKKNRLTEPLDFPPIFWAHSGALARAFNLSSRSVYSRPRERRIRNRLTEPVDSVLIFWANLMLHFSLGLVFAWCLHRALSIAAIPCHHRSRKLSRAEMRRGNYPGLRRPRPEVARGRGHLGSLGCGEWEGLGV